MSERRWTALLVGENHGLLGKRGLPFESAPPEHERVNVVEERPGESQARCPFPCGWEELHKIAVRDAAHVARSLHPDEPVTDELRASTIRLHLYLLDIIREMQDRERRAEP